MTSQTSFLKFAGFNFVGIPTLATAMKGTLDLTGTYTCVAEKVVESVNWLLPLLPSFYQGANAQDPLNTTTTGDNFTQSTPEYSYEWVKSVFCMGALLATYKCTLYSCSKFNKLAALGATLTSIAATIFTFEMVKNHLGFNESDETYYPLKTLVALSGLIIDLTIFLVSRSTSKQKTN